MNFKLLLILVLLLSGCGANPPLTPTLTPTQPETIASPTLAPTSFSPTTLSETPTSSSLTNNDLLQIYPLKQGAQWVYRELAYDTLPNDRLPEVYPRQITATLVVTDTVVETQTLAQNYAAKVVHERAVITSTIDLNLLGDAREYYFTTDTPFTKWYIFLPDKIVSQIEVLNWDAVEEAQIEFKLPIRPGECWYPDPNVQYDCSGNDPQGTIPGFRRLDLVDPQNAFPGISTHCYQVMDRYNPGNIFQQFCEGIGIVSNDFDHAGTPFGSHSVLIKFTPGQ